MFNSSGESGHPYLPPDLLENIQSFTIKYSISCGVFIDTLYQVEEVFFFIRFVEYFYHEGLLDFCQVLTDAKLQR